MGEHEAISNALREAGVDVGPWVDSEPFMAIAALFGERDEELQFLEDIATLDNGRNDAPLTKVDRWSLKELGDLVFASGYSSVGVGSFRTTFQYDDRETRASWLQCIAVAYQIDGAAAATQARHLLMHPRSRFGAPHDWWIVSARPDYERTSVEPESLTSDQQATLLKALEAHSDWIAWSAANILAQTQPKWDTAAFFERDRSEWKPDRAMIFPLVCILASPDGADLVQRAASSADSSRRQAAALAVKVNPALDPDGEVARDLSLDDDLTVRGDLDVGDPPPRHWSCNECGTVNDIETIDCPGCDKGTRPTRKESPQGEQGR